MLNRRTFLKSLLVAATIPVVTTVHAEPDFPFHDVGARGKFTDEEYQYIKAYMKDYLSAGHDEPYEIRWGLWGETSHLQGVLVDNQYVVTWKPHIRKHIIYIELERV